MISRALPATGDFQSRNSSVTSASAVFGTAPACASRSIAVRCASCDSPPTASTTNRLVAILKASTTGNARQISV